MAGALISNIPQSPYGSPLAIHPCAARHRGSTLHPRVPGFNGAICLGVEGGDERLPGADLSRSEICERRHPHVVNEGENRTVDKSPF